MSRVHGQDQALPYTAATPRLCKRTTKPLAWKPLWEGSCSLPLAVCCSCIHQKKTLFSFPHDVLLLGCVWRGHRQRQQGSALGNVITSFPPGLSPQSRHSNKTGQSTQHSTGPKLCTGHICRGCAPVCRPSQSQGLGVQSSDGWRPKTMWSHLIAWTEGRGYIKHCHQPLSAPVSHCSLSNQKYSGEGREVPFGDPSSTTHSSIVSASCPALSQETAVTKAADGLSQASLLQTCPPP